MVQMEKQKKKKSTNRRSEHPVDSTNALGILDLTLYCKPRTTKWGKIAHRLHR